VVLVTMVARTTIKATMVMMPLLLLLLLSLLVLLFFRSLSQLQARPRVLRELLPLAQ